MVAKRSGYYYIFGDTFCNDAGISSNTVQYIPDISKPTNACYSAEEDNGLVKPLIELNSDEVWELQQPENVGKRFAFWCFGGVVEVSPGLGWTWYQKHRISSDGTGELYGVGVARISHDNANPTPELSCTRMPGLMFDKGLPLFGSFSALLHGDVVYLWGQRGEDVCLARVPKRECHRQSSYEFWNGTGYVGVVDAATPVLQDFQQGQIFQSHLFGPRLPWVIVGVTKWADSMVMIGAASKLEGPWDIRPLFCAQGIKKPDAYQYCVYPHPWASDRMQNELMISWCDPWPGGVILAKVKFDTHDRVFWASIVMGFCGAKVASVTTMKAHEVCRGIHVQCTELDNPPRLYLSGGHHCAVQMAVNEVRAHMAQAIEGEASGAGMERRRGPRVVGFIAKILGCGG